MAEPKGYSSDLRITPPSYAELPVTSSAPPGSSWGVWGDIGTDFFGCLNLLTPERIVEASRLITRGAVFGLNLDMRLPDPPLFGRAAFDHTVTGSPVATSHDDMLDNWNTQSSSQWDGFRHIRSDPHGHYGGVADEHHSIGHWAERGIVGRAVLCDIERYRNAIGRPLQYDQPDPIEPGDIGAALESQGTELRTGDVLLLHTGWLRWYRWQSMERRRQLAGELACPGLRPGENTARYLWDLHISAIGADNPAVEVWPPGALMAADEFAAVRADRSRMPEVFVHTQLLPLLGLPLGEMWNLTPLADDCAQDGRYECFFTSAPINLPSGVASPPNALAIK